MLFIKTFRFKIKFKRKGTSVDLSVENLNVEKLKLMERIKVYIFVFGGLDGKGARFID